MASTTARYPLATQNGTPIPLEIIKPHSLIMAEIFIATPTATFTVPEGIEIMSVTCSEDCVLVFGGVAAVPAFNTPLLDAMIIERDVRVCIAPPVSTFSLIAISADGEVRIQFVNSWAGLSLPVQLNRI